MASHICKLCRFLGRAALSASAPGTAGCGPAPSLKWMHFSDFTTCLPRFARNADMFVWPFSVQVNCSNKMKLIHCLTLKKFCETAVLLWDAHGFHGYFTKTNLWNRDFT